MWTSSAGTIGPNLQESTDAGQLQSEYWPKTVEGRILGWLLAVYAFAVFGYITATIASFFIAQDVAMVAQRQADEGAITQTDATGLREEVAALRSEVATLSRLLATSSASPPQARSAHGS